MTTCAWVGRGARGWVGVEVGAPVTQAFLGARSLQAGLSRGGTPPAVLARWREDGYLGDLFLDQILIEEKLAKEPLRGFFGALREATKGNIMFALTSDESGELNCTTQCNCFF